MGAVPEEEGSNPVESRSKNPTGQVLLRASEDTRRRHMSFEDPDFDPVAYINDRFPDGTTVSPLPGVHLKTTLCARVPFIRCCFRCRGISV